MTQLAADVVASRRGQRALSWVVATQMLVAISAIAALLDDRLVHWFLIPVTVCGILVGVDVVDWMRGRLDIFSPRALLALFGLHFLYLAPILHVTWNYFALFIAPLEDWRSGLGDMAILNMIGLLVYRAILELWPTPRQKEDWADVNIKTFRSWMKIGIFFSLIAAAAVLARFGGISGYLATVTDARDTLAGTGSLLLVAEAFPLLAFVLVVVNRREKLRTSPVVLTGLIVAFALCQFLVAGLRGSRSNTIWPILIALIVVHLLVRPLSRKTLVVGVLVLGSFMYLYSFYKAQGADAVSQIRSGQIGSLSAETGRGLPDLLLGDLGRSDIQALVLERQQERGISPVNGETYLYGAAFLLPSSVFDGSGVSSKVAAGTDVLYGEGTYVSGASSSRIYGLAGEGILNFGKAGAVGAFAVLGFFIRFTDRLYVRARDGDNLRMKLIAPSLAVASVLALGQDFDNIVFFLMRQALPLAFIAWVASRSQVARRRRSTTW
jgi:hypothetical protein